jgi:hypothetical protein
MPWASPPGLRRTRYVAATDADAAVRPYDASVGERDNSWRVAVGAGSPAGPDTVAGDHGPPSTDVVQAVADFVEDLVEDPAEDPGQDPAGAEDDA